VGIATWNVEYRRLGNDGGGWPGTFLDVARATDAVRDLVAGYRLDMDRVVALGHSAGGQLALWLAGRRRIAAASTLAAPDPLSLRGAISLAGVCDLREAWERQLSNTVVRDLLGGAPEAVPERYDVASPASLLPLGVPQWVVHGTADESVPYAISERYAARARAAGDDVTFVRLEGVGHFEVVDPETSVWGQVQEVIEEALAQS
jgi:acetyl esterase/lipase